MAEGDIENKEGNCYQCDLYDKVNDCCKRGERAFGSMNSPICLQKLTVILLRDLVTLLEEYLFEEDD